MELNQILGVLGNAWLLSVFILALIFGLVVMRAKLSQSIKFLEVTKRELYMSRRIIREKVNYKRMQSLACTYSEYFSLDILGSSPLLHIFFFLGIVVSSTNVFLVVTALYLLFAYRARDHSILWIKDDDYTKNYWNIHCQSVTFPHVAVLWIDYILSTKCFLVLCANLIENCTDAINIFNAAKNLVLSGTGQCSYWFNADSLRLSEEKSNSSAKRENRFSQVEDGASDERGDCIDCFWHLSPSTEGV
jgi:hypothetical protein